MNSFFNTAMQMMPAPMKNMMALVQQARQIQQHPEMLSQVLQQKGMISAQQAQDILGMGNNYEQIGQYLINNGKIPQNYHQFDGQINQVQNYLNTK